MQRKTSLFLAAVLSAQTLLLLLYTYFAGTNEGWNLVQYLIQHVQSMGWAGQFNLDFACYLLLSALWVLWRYRYQPVSWPLALLAMVGGILFFAPYLLYLLYKHQGDLTAVLLGTQRQ